MTLKRLLLGSIFFGWLEGVPPEAWAGTCALCREVLRQGVNGNLIKGYYWSIIVLVGVPLVILYKGIRYAWRRY
jgi:hypothetical protein